MTAQPQSFSRLLTVAEYAALGEDEFGRTELQEGSLVMSPSPTANHNLAAFRLAMQLTPQLPGDLEVLPDLDVDLQLAAPDEPGSARRPDVIVARRAARQRVEAEGGIIRAGEVVVTVEIVSPGSRRTDHVVKRAEYADAGIPHYWIVDIERPVSLLTCRLAERFGYREDQACTGTFTTEEPFPVSLKLDELLS